MEDEKIVQLYWDRDERAIPETAAKYGGYCTSIAQNILGSAEDAEECVNDTYMSAWNSIPPHRPGNLCTFLGKLTRNLSLNRYRYNTAHKRGRRRGACRRPRAGHLGAGTGADAGHDARGGARTPGRHSGCRLRHLRVRL